MSSQLSLLYTTFATQEDAVRVSQVLLKKHLIACANISSEMRSLYLWEGRMEDSKEIGVFLKTTVEKVPALMAALEDLHPYSIPVMLEMPINRANESWYQWVQECVR